MNELPPLPHPVTNALMGDDFEDLYTADQMREYGRACERAAYERAAQECENAYEAAPQWGRNDNEYAAQVTAKPRAAAIRALGADKCPDGLTPDGPVCPRCGGRRGPSGVDGGSWVHY